MEVTALCFRLLMLEFLLLETRVQSLYARQSGAASLRITPDRLQFFQRESISFHCDGTDGSAQFRKVRNGILSPTACVMKSTSSGSSCTINRAYQSDSGEYWCETKGGERSNSIDVTITGGSVILESPALPVMEGDTVTLHCRNKTTSTNLKAVFYKDNIPINYSSAQEIRMNNVSKSDEGLYKCSIQGAGESAESRLTVTAHEESVSNDSDSTKHRSLQWIIIVSTVALMLLLLLLLLGFSHVSKHRVCSKTSRTSNSVFGVDDADDPNSLTYAVVVTKKRKNADTADTGESLNVCTETNHNREAQTENGSSRSTSSQNLRAAKEPQEEIVYASVQFTENRQN